MQIAIINGPNLNLVGVREPEIYGDITFDEYIPLLREQYRDSKITYLQTNHEGVIIDRLHEVGFKVDAIILNAGGLTHTSICLMDAVKGITTPVIEVHISDIHQREEYRRHSYLSDVSSHTIMGQGLDGYRQAIEWAKANL